MAAEGDDLNTARREVGRDTVAGSILQLRVEDCCIRLARSQPFLRIGTGGEWSGNVKSRGLQAIFKL